MQFKRAMCLLLTVFIMSAPLHTETLDAGTDSSEADPSAEYMIALDGRDQAPEADEMLVNGSLCLEPCRLAFDRDANAAAAEHEGNGITITVRGTWGLSSTLTNQIESVSEIPLGSVRIFGVGVIGVNR